MTVEEVNSLVSRVAAKKYEWASLSPQKKLEIIDLLLDNVNSNSERLLAASITKRDGPADEAPSYRALAAREQDAMRDASKVTHYLHSPMVRQPFTH